jgi:hypothetical protein
MKYIHKNILAIGVAFSMVIACTNDFEETNVNPNQPGEVPTAYLFTYAVETILDQLYGGFDNTGPLPTIQHGTHSIPGCIIFRKLYGSTKQASWSVATMRSLWRVL